MALRLLLVSSFFVFLFLYAPTSEGRPVKAARQYLPPLPGYIPVYIQDGDSPPDVESIYEVLDGQSPADDKMDTDVQLDDPYFDGEPYYELFHAVLDIEMSISEHFSGRTGLKDVPQKVDSDPDSILRESKDFIVQQLLRGVPRDNVVQELQELRGVQPKA